MKRTEGRVEMKGREEHNLPPKATAIDTLDGYRYEGDFFMVIDDHGRPVVFVGYVERFRNASGYWFTVGGATMHLGEDNVNERAFPVQGIKSWDTAP